MSSVLVLNASYEPLNVVSVRRAVVLLLKDKAEVLEAAERHIRSAHSSMAVPLVIRLVYYVRVPRRVNVPCTRRMVMIRDNYTCQYCGKQPAKNQLTIDHVIPRMRGGLTTWDNVVCACKSCNLRKGHQSLQQARMKLRTKPEAPRYLAMVFFSQRAADDTWLKYLPEDAELPPAFGRSAGLT